MAGGKEYPLSITIRTVDKATSGLKRINDQVDRTLKPIRGLRDELGRLGQNSGIGKIGAGLAGLGGQLKSIAKGVGVIGGVAAGAAYGFKGLVDEFDALGDKAEALGVTVSRLVQMRYAAEQSGAEVDALDSSLAAFNKNLGQVSAGTGRLTGFLKKASPALLRQIKGAKDGGEAFDLLADAMSKLDDQGEKTALAAAAGFDPSLIPLLSKGAAGVRALRMEVEESSKAQEEAAKAAGPADESWKRLIGRLQQVKANIVTGLAPAFAQLLERASAFFDANKEKIAAWIADFGEKLPGRLQRLGEVLLGIKDNFLVPLVNAVGWLVDKLGGAENAIKALAIAWGTFQAVKVVGSLVQIAQGLVGIATTATSAAAALRGVGGAAGALGGAAGVLGRLGAVAGAGAAGYGIGTAISHGLDLNEGDSGYHDDYADPRDPNAARRAENARRRRLGLPPLPKKQAQPPIPVSSATGLTLDSGALGVPDLFGQPSEALVKIEVSAPKGTRATVDPSSTADVELATGVQLVTP